MSGFAPKRILAPVDLSPASRKTLGWAGLMARAWSAELEVVYADWWEPPRYFTESQIAALKRQALEHRQAVHRELEVLVSESAGAGLPHAVAVVEGRPAEAILQRARSRAADLIIVGSHGRTGLARFRLGSVAEEVAREAGRPVLVVNVLEAGDAPAQVRNVLCPVNFTPLARQSLEVAADVAARLGAQLAVVHAVEAEAADLDAAHRELCAWVPSAARGKCKVSEAVRRGKAAEQILLLAREQHADLIVLGAERRLLLEWTTLGTTTERVMRHGVAPVLVVPRAESS
jgi:nucleotide-binding universal stress UspA family protein